MSFDLHILTNVQHLASGADVRLCTSVLRIYFILSPEREQGSLHCP